MLKHQNKSNPYSMSQIYDDHSSWDHATRVHIADKIMDINIYNVLRIAYIDHYREKPGDRVIETCFKDFMFTNFAPKWAIRFSEKIIEENNKGLYEPIRYGVKPRSLPLRHVREGSLLPAIAIIVALILFIALSA